jgi:hypothetical protein
MRTTSRNLTLVVTALCLLGLSAQAKQSMELSANYFDFGYVPQDVDISHVFWIKPAGEQKLRIAKVVPGCSCAKAPLDKFEIQPGDSARLEIIFSTGKFNGPVSRRPAVYAATSAEATVLTIHSTVLTNTDTTWPVILNPSIMDISQFGDTVRSVFKLEIENVSDQTLKPGLIAAPEEFVEVDLPESIEGKQSALATITVRKDKLGTAFKKSFTFELNNEQKSRFTVPLTREISYPPVKSPSTLPPR